MADTPDSGPLPDAEVRAWAGEHHPWRFEGERIDRTYRFASFGDAVRFMTLLHPFIEETDHHPDWRNVYDQVWVALDTHSAGGVTHKDLRLAEEMDRRAHEVGTRP